MKKNYLFLLAWVHGSDSAPCEGTKVHNQDDLLPQFEAGNGNVFALHIECNHDFVPEEMIESFGYKKAFFENYTALDSVSTLINLNHTHSISIRRRIGACAKIKIEFAMSVSDMSL